jgi:hypothetical protein
MFIWGSNSKNIGKRRLDAECSICHKHDLSLVALQRMGHVFWIPTIPFGKTFHVVCESCGTAYPPEPYLAQMPEADRKFRTPWWGFIGLIIGLPLIIGGIVLAEYEGRARVATVAEFKTNPVAGVYFVFKMSDREVPFGFGKIESVNDEKIGVRISHYFYSKERSAEKAAESCKGTSNDCLTPGTKELSRQEFKDLAIQDIVK